MEVSGEDITLFQVMGCNNGTMVVAGKATLGRGEIHRIWELEETTASSSRPFQDQSLHSWRNGGDLHAKSKVNMTKELSPSWGWAAEERTSSGLPC